MDKAKRVHRARRGFLRTATLGAGAAAVATTASAEIIAPPAAEVATPVKTTKKGYQETAHVRRYYDLARF